MNFTAHYFIPRPGDIGIGSTLPLMRASTFRLKRHERQTHCYILGISGQGKSKLMERMIVDSILAGEGVCLTDPHHDLARDVLVHLDQVGFLKRKGSRERVIYFDPARSDTTAPFNVLSVPYADPYTVASNLVEAFRRVWSQSLAEAPRFSDILLHALLVLIDNHLTLCQLQELLVRRDYRETLLEKVSDPNVISFFHDRFDKWGREQPLMIESTLNKVSALTLNPELRRILGTSNNVFNFREMMDCGQVLIVDLGRCNDETERFLGAFIATGIEQAALSRNDDAGKRRPFYFFLDEFQSFVANEGSTKTLAKILSESRKFGLFLTLAHQTLGQMSERMKSALSNMGVKIVFQTGRQDAEEMAPILFQVDLEEVKHTVENEASQDRTHPIFYSVHEQFEKAVQQVQNLPVGRALVKAPRRKVAQVRIKKTPKRVYTETQLERLYALLSPKGVSVNDAPSEKKVEKLVTQECDLFYEETKVKPQNRNRVSLITKTPGLQFGFGPS